MAVLAAASGKSDAERGQDFLGCTWSPVPGNEPVAKPALSYPKGDTVNKSTTIRIAGFVGSLGATAALVGAAASGTGAYFTDAKPGNISGTMGSIRITAYDGGGTSATDIAFTDMLPGEGQVKTVRYQNTGKNTEDVWLVFNQADLGDFNSHTDTGKVNDMGHFGEIHVSSNGTEVFGSKNLNDDATSCPPAGTDCNPLPAKIKLADGVTPGTVGGFAFSFTPGANTGNWGQEATRLNLGYQLVATQHGIAPQ